MRCADVQALLIDAGAAARPEQRREAIEHLATCASCRDAQFAAGVLRAERGQAVPPPRPGALERAIAAATGGAATRPPPRNPRRAAGFLAGLAAGAGSAAIAAAIAWALVGVDREPAAPEASTTPLVTLALNEVRDVSISVDAPAALRDAEIRVVLTGSISLGGLAGQRELRWRTDLEAGANQLTLPLVATAAAGGQLLVEVQHGQRRKTFVVDVRGTEA
ncbi:MAG: hypothetical protein C0P79_009335 [Gammaproteobacteria bacterium]